jgi:hypothetical protein
MELKDFIGQVVICAATKRRFRLYEITAPETCVVTEKPGSSGYLEHYTYRNINGNPISTGVLLCEKPELTEPFKAAFDAYERTEDAYWENYGYWMRRD